MVYYKNISKLKVTKVIEERESLGKQFRIYGMFE